MTMNDSSGAGRSIQKSLRPALNGLVALCLNRIELFGVECQTLKADLFRGLVLVGIALATLFLALASLIALIVIATPAEWRLLALGVIILLLLLTGGGCLYVVYKQFSEQEMPFSTTVNEMRKDWAILNRR